MTAPQNPRVTQAVEWLRAISTWLLETDNDMKLPNGILDVDPLDIADALEAAEAASKAREAALVEVLTVAARTMEAAEERMGKFARANIGIIGGACPRHGAQELRQGVKAARAALTKEPGA